MRTQSLVSFVTLALFASSSLANPVPVPGSNGYKDSLRVARDVVEGMHYNRLQYRQAASSAPPDVAGTAQSEVSSVKGALQGAAAGGANPVVGLMGSVRRDGVGVGPSGVAVNKLLTNDGSSSNLEYVQGVSNPAAQVVTAQAPALKGVNSDNVVQNSGYGTAYTTPFGSGVAPAHIPVRVGLDDGQDGQGSFTKTIADSLRSLFGGDFKSDGASSTDQATLPVSSSESSGLADSLVSSDPSAIESNMDTLSGSTAGLDNDPSQAAAGAINSKNVPNPLHGTFDLPFVGGNPNMTPDNMNKDLNNLAHDDNAHAANTGLVQSGNPIVASVGSPGATDDNVKGGVDQVTSVGLDDNKALGKLGGGNTNLVGGSGAGSDEGPITSFFHTFFPGSKASDSSASSVSPSAGGKPGDLTHLPVVDGLLDSHSGVLSGSTLTGSTGTGSPDGSTSDSGSGGGFGSFLGGIFGGSAQTTSPNIPVGTPAQPEGQPLNGPDDSADGNANGNIANVGMDVGNIPAPNVGGNGIPALGSSGPASSSPNLGNVPNVPSGSVPNLPIPNGGANGLPNIPSGSIPSFGSPGQIGSPPSIPGLASSGSQGSIPGFGGIPNAPSGSVPSLPIPNGGTNGIPGVPSGSIPSFGAGSTSSIPGFGPSGSQASIPGFGGSVPNIPIPNNGASGSVGSAPSIPGFGPSGSPGSLPGFGGLPSGSVPSLGSQGPSGSTPSLPGFGGLPTPPSGSIPSLSSPGINGKSTPSIPGFGPSGSQGSIPGFGGIPGVGSQGNSGAGPSIPGFGGAPGVPSLGSGSTPSIPGFGSTGSTPSIPGLGSSGSQGSIPTVDNLPHPIPGLDTNAGMSTSNGPNSVEISLGNGKPDLSSTSNGSMDTSNAPTNSASNPFIGPDGLHFGPGPVIVDPSSSGSNTGSTSVTGSAPPSSTNTKPPSFSPNNGNSGSGSSTPTGNPAPNTTPSTTLGSGSAALPYPFNFPTGAYPYTFPYQYVEGKGWVAPDGSVLPFGPISPDVLMNNGSPFTGPNGVKYQYIPGSGIVGSDGSIFPIQYVAGQGYMASGGNMVYGSNGVYYAPNGVAYASNGVPYGPSGIPTDTKDGGVLSSATGSDAISHILSRDEHMLQFDGAAAQNKVVDTCLESALESTHMKQSRWFKGDALNDAMTAEPVPNAITTAEDAVAYPLNMRRGDSDGNNANDNGVAGNGENNGNNNQYRGNNGNDENNGNGALANNRNNGSQSGYNGNGANNNNGVLGNNGNGERNGNNGNVRAYANQGGVGGANRYNYEMTDLEALNYLLTLEEFETAFYEQSLGRFSEEDFLNLGYPRWVRPRYEQILSHERVHKEFLQSAITSAGQNYVEPCNYELSNVNDPRNFVEFSEAIQSIIASAYVGILRYFNERSYITAGASMLSVEARQAAWINSAVRHKNPWNSAFETALTPSQVYTLLSCFFEFNSLSEENRALLPAGIWPAPRLSLAPRLLPGQQGEISFPYPNLNEHECLYVVFLTGAANIVAPLINQNNGHYFVEIPLELEGAGTVYIVLIRGSDNIGDVTVSDQTTVAGPAIAEFPYNAEGKRGNW